MEGFFLTWDSYAVSQTNLLYTTCMAMKEI